MATSAASEPLKKENSISKLTFFVQLTNFLVVLRTPSTVDLKVMIKNSKLYEPSKIDRTDVCTYRDVL